MKKRITMGLLLLSSALMAQTANVDVKLKAVTAIIINGGAHTNPTGTASKGTPGTNVLDFGTYIMGDTARLESNATIYFDNLDLTHNTLNISIPSTINLTDSSNTIPVALQLDKTSLTNSDVITNSANINLNGIILDPNTNITAAGSYTGSVPVTVTLN